MTQATLRRSGGSLIMTIPSIFAEQNHLSAGDNVVLDINGPSMTVRVEKRRERKRYDLKELVANTDPVFLKPVWDDVLPVGREV